MTVKSDRWIRRMAEEAQLIHPFEARLVREVAGMRIISAGASSYGYDMRLADDGFRVFSPIHGREIDPKHFDDSSLVEPPLQTAADGSKYYLLPPHSYALGVTVETFRMPRNVTGIAMGKSTYARAGLLVNTTPLEAGWVGRLVGESCRSAFADLCQRRHRPGCLPRVRRRMRCELRRSRRQVPGTDGADLFKTLENR